MRFEPKRGQRQADQARDSRASKGELGPTKATPGWVSVSDIKLTNAACKPQDDRHHSSKLKLLVPSVGTFFTRLPLAEAFEYQDRRRCISSRRFVPPSFNDVRQILNTAQLRGIVTGGRLELATFDGDVTLYDDGKNLQPDNPCIPRIINLLGRDVKVGLVTAAGYTEAERYYERLWGLLDAIAASESLTLAQKENLVVMGGESNFLFTFSLASPFLLEYHHRREWIVPEMSAWTQENITHLLDLAEASLRECLAHFGLPATVLRKERAVGIIPSSACPPDYRFPRELLEETVLVVQKRLEMSEVGRHLPFCAFNGGNDVFVDIGDKSWGVLAVQKWFGQRAGRSAGEAESAAGGIRPERTLHVGDQFLSAGSNDFKARVVATTAWIASPLETVELLDELATLLEEKEKKSR